MATFVLIPGAGGDPWEWHRLARELEARGHDVVPVQLPAGDDSAGWAEYADAVVEAIGERGEVVLVAQSLAGFSAPLVAERVPIDLIVLLNAMIPIPGETGNAWWSNTRQREAVEAYYASVGLPAETANDEVAVYMHDVPPEIVEEAATHIPEQSMTPMEQPWPLTSWPDVPTRVLIGGDDRLFPAAFQRRVAKERLGLDGDVIEGGHMVALSRPGDVGDRLEAYWREVDSNR
ncbi:MAG TPA: alpha/beta hydrolase [Acidimicrobiia bacterium]|nr:alpha/beta hydrolase [Acidimicrobiia bacterium]